MARRVAVAVLLLPFLVGFAFLPADAQTPKRGGVIRIAEREAPGLDPHLTISFLSFGLFAPRNRVTVTALLVAALSVGGAVFLILELDRPFEGIIRISPDPVEFAYAHIGP